jgi:NAD(P)-dependent dehydrogenase (short-subunit alcohol dehydrogenase family)
MTTLAGSTALITGGASGIGLLLGKELIRRGRRQGRCRRAGRAFWGVAPGRQVDGACCEQRQAGCDPTVPLRRTRRGDRDARALCEPHRMLDPVPDR